MTTGVLSKLEARGYWRLEVRPVDYLERRVASVMDLQRAVEKARVQFRGWDFPHIESSSALPESQTWTGVETDWSVHVEIWRAFLSGQFIYRGGVWNDWVDQHHFSGRERDIAPKTQMLIVGSLWSITEFCEFAARYCQTEAGADSMYLEIRFHGLKGRVLAGDSDRRIWFQNYGPAKLDDFEFTRTLTRTELISTPAKIAVSCSSELFALFGWQSAPGLLEEIQAELFQVRR